mmetsp:Transcript_12710/g.25802  ORF Transcript_12710/g.25802 Transcript_12710/m.25802 type:complete len:213 (+) Transcript_12710:263-901(+)
MLTGMSRRSRTSTDLAGTIRHRPVALSSGCSGSSVSRRISRTGWPIPYLSSAPSNQFRGGGTSARARSLSVLPYHITARSIGVCWSSSVTDGNGELDSRMLLSLAACKIWARFPCCLRLLNAALRLRRLLRLRIRAPRESHHMHAFSNQPMCSIDSEISPCTRIVCAASWDGSFPSSPSTPVSPTDPVLESLPTDTDTVPCPPPTSVSTTKS